MSRQQCVSRPANAIAHNHLPARMYAALYRACRSQSHLIVARSTAPTYAGRPTTAVANEFPIVAVAAGAGGGVLLLGLILVICFSRKRGEQKRAGAQRDVAMQGWL